MIILFWSAFVVFAFTYEFFYPQRTEVLKLLDFGDSVSCLFFLIDVIWRWRASEDRVRFWRWGWIDLLASIPMVGSSMRMARLFRVFRIFRVIRAMRSLTRIITYFFADKVKSTMASAATLLFGSIFIGGVLILHFEAGQAASNINSPLDAFWWAVTTITTVGYGDTFPHTAAGRGVGVALMFVGITIFGINTALVSGWLVKSLNKKTAQEESDILAEIKSLRAELAQLRASLIPAGTPSSAERPSRSEETPPPQADGNKGAVSA